MFRHYRVLAATVLALSLTGCAGLSLPGLSSASSATSEESASVTVTIGAGYQTQATSSNIALTLRLELPWAQDPSKRVQVLTVQPGVPIEFKNLPTGYGTLTAIATDTGTREIVDKQSQPVQLRPGYQAQAAFHLVIGGSSALDLGVSAWPERLHMRQERLEDGLDDAFQHYMVPYGPIAFTWYTATQSVPVTFSVGGFNSLMRRIGDGPEDPLGNAEDWITVPKHAVRMDNAPLGRFDAVRHFRWDNLYRVGDGERAYVIDRWISPDVGLLKETVSEPGEAEPLLLSTLERVDLYPSKGEL